MVQQEIKTYWRYSTHSNENVLKTYLFNQCVLTLHFDGGRTFAKIWNWIEVKQTVHWTVALAETGTGISVFNVWSLFILVTCNQKGNKKAFHAAWGTNTIRFIVQPDIPTKNNAFHYNTQRSTLNTNCKQINLLQCKNSHVWTCMLTNLQELLKPYIILWHLQKLASSHILSSNGGAANTFLLRAKHVPLFSCLCFKTENLKKKKVIL